MFLSTLGIGFLPMVCRCNQKFMDLMAIYGGGLLIGAALIVIIPEGLLVLLASMAPTKVSE